MTDLKDILSKQGKFWFAGATEETGAFGALSITSDGTSYLTLGKAFNSQAIDYKKSDSFMYQPHEVFGKLEDGRYVFLQECYVEDSSRSSVGSLPNKLRSQICIITDKYEIDKDFEYNIEHIRFPLGPLLPWFRPEMPTSTESDGNRTLTYPASTKETFNIRIGTVDIENELLFDFDGKKRLVTPRLDGCLKFTPYSTLSIESIIEFMKHLEDFLLIFTDQTVDLPWPVIQLSSDAGSAEFYFTRMEMKPAEYSHLDCWLNYRQLQPEFEKILSSWFAKKDTFGPAFYLYAGNKRVVSMYEEHRFMNAVTGFESFHYATKRTIPKNENLEKKISRILNALPTSLKSADRRWASKQAENCLEPTLSERLQDLILSLPLDLDKKEVKDFADRCSTFRNDISHYGGPRSKGDYRKFTRDIHLLHCALYPLYHALLLSEIGVSAKLIQLAIFNPRVGGRIRFELKEANLNLPSQSAKPTSP